MKPDTNSINQNGMFTDRPNTFFNDFSFKEATHNTCVLLIYAGWSSFARAAKSLLVNSLAEFPDIELFILDNDEKDTFNYMITNDLFSHGWGETYWIQDGQIVSAVKRYPVSMEDLISKHHLLATKSDLTE
ncbi:hypothetical protein [Chitinophaga sancti]|uniref:Thioredoxin n=1 Tax=Chitinophaga sancti TaxID=1004 RepID=A0A1K1RQ32_9BACT|nr:hypothetical protein [Chitinophaga sancti]WQD62522.1 hypothetical protein U0033_32020 [Chitinophaga sancti]WQG91909.1 hypothetical protein SR876_10365 [Chitinophaga sancti]SFW74158.1 hypothetical protein SAMN05661012_04110 [Chitinophaga sancti]